MRSKRFLSNWTLMVIYTVVLVLGFISACFLLAFYWRVDTIARVDPFAADYSAEASIILAPLNAQIVQSVLRDIGEVANVDDPNPSGDRGKESISPTPTTLSETPTSQSSASPTTINSTLTPSVTATQLHTSTSSPTATNTLEPTLSVTQDTPTSTIKPTKKPTSTPEPRPTNPPTATSIPDPKPTKTNDPYPPRPYP